MYITNDFQTENPDLHFINASRNILNIYYSENSINSLEKEISYFSLKRNIYTSIIRLQKKISLWFHKNISSTKFYQKTFTNIFKVLGFKRMVNTTQKGGCHMQPISNTEASSIGCTRKRFETVNKATDLSLIVTLLTNDSETINPASETGSANNADDCRYFVPSIINIATLSMINACTTLIISLKLKMTAANDLFFSNDYEYVNYNTRNFNNIYSSCNKNKPIINNFCDLINKLTFNNYHMFLLTNLSK